MTKITVHTCPYKGFRHITVGADTSSYTARQYGRYWRIFKGNDVVGSTTKVRRIEFIIGQTLGA